MDIQMYDSYEESMAALAERIAQLNENLLPRQVAIRDSAGDQQYVVAINDDEDLLIYGDIPAAEDPALREQGYLTGMWYSAWEEDGEYGDNHVAMVLFSIPPSAFELARRLHWPTVSDLRAAASKPGTDIHTLAVKMAAAEAMSIIVHGRR